MLWAMMVGGGKEVGVGREKDWNREEEETDKWGLNKYRKRGSRRTGRVLVSPNFSLFLFESHQNLALDRQRGDLEGRFYFYKDREMSIINIESLKLLRICQHQRRTHPLLAN